MAHANANLTSSKLNWVKALPRIHTGENSFSPRVVKIPNILSKKVVLSQFCGPPNIISFNEELSLNLDELFWEYVNKLNFVMLADLAIERWKVRRFASNH